MKSQKYRVFSQSISWTTPFKLLPFPKCIAWDAGSHIHSAGLAVCYVHSVAGGRIMLKVLIRKSLHVLRTELLLLGLSIRTWTLY